MEIRFDSLALALCALALPGVSQETHYQVRLDEVELTSGSLPDYGATFPREAWREYGFLLPYVVLEGEGTAFVHQPGHSVGAPWNQPTTLALANLCVRRPQPGEVRGRLYVPDAEWKGMLGLDFRIAPDAADPEAESAFQQAAAWHFDQLFERGAAGAAWFRHLRRSLVAESGGAVPRRPQTVTAPTLDSVEAYSLFSGGRAVSENLQLDRTAPLPENVTGEDVAIDEIEGITTPAYDWDALMSEETPALDPLATLVPADQHALFFPSFGALVQVADEAARHGAPFVGAFEERSHDALTREGYELQLCLPLDGAARALGSLVVASVAITGSDPYLRTGSDLAVLFEPRQAEALRTFLEARQEAALRMDLRGLERVEGDVLGTSYRGVVSASRAVSSYLATVGEALVVTNSLHQLERIVTAASAVDESLAGEGEYSYFRQRYPRDEGESAFLLLPDAAIRRWCGPRWRIGTARRVHAAGYLTDMQAAYAEALLTGQAPGDPLLEPPDGAPPLGELAYTESGVRSSVFGDIAFQTPIAELPLERVTSEEARMYGLWREGYERNWSGFFDPIAIQLFVEEDQLGFDVTVMPLITGTEYREFTSVTGNARLDPQAGDRHAGTLLHFVMALDTEGTMLRRMNESLSSMLSDAGVDLLDWLGGSFAIYVEESDVWDDLAEAEDLDEALEDLWVDLESVPIAIHLDVKSPLKLATFLVAMRSLADQTAPGAARWETRTHGEERYVRIASDWVEDDFAVYYATPPGSFILTFSEKTIHAAIERLGASASEPSEETAGEDATDGWLGESVALEVDGRAVGLFSGLFGEDLHRIQRHASWNNLPVLNEWRRRHPDRDPVQVHEELWHERLVCPGGGTYVWNEEWHTMESTVYGHPGERRKGPQLPEPYASIERAHFGLTLADDSLRARARVER